MAAQRAARLLTHDREHRHVIEPSVVKPSDQMRSAWTLGGDTYTKLAREFCIGARHKRRHFFVSCLNERDLVGRSIERAEHAVDSIKPG
jgi:hypothetical protein